MGNLAVNGGTPVREIPYPSWPHSRGREAERLKEVLQSGEWGLPNPVLDELAEQYQRFTGAKYALPVTNGTVALEVIFRALGIGRGDEVIVPLYTFVASVSAIILVGATPVFADISEDSHLLDPASVEARITKKTKAILAVHIGGRPCDLDVLCALAHSYGLYLVEDAAQAHGAQWREHRIGTLGIAGSFSFQASKNLPCGEGGIITTNNEALYHEMWSIANYGRNFESDIWYEHIGLGTNACMGAWQAAVLLEQLRDADTLIEKRMESCRYLTEQLHGFPFLEFLKEDSRIVKNACHLFLFRYQKAGLNGIPRELFLKALHAEGITAIGPGYSEPINRMKLLASPSFYHMTGTSRSYDNINTPVADRIAREEGVWIVQSALLEGKQEQQLIVDAMEKLLKNGNELIDT